MTASPIKQRLAERLVELETATGWRTVKSPEHVESSVLDRPDLDYPVVRCITELGCGAEVAMAFLVDDVTETLPSWSRDIEACEQIERISVDERILLVRTVPPTPLVAAREDLFYQARGQEADGGYYEISEVTDAVEVPVAPGAVRSHMHFASKRIQPRPGGGCTYDVMWQYDPMGRLSRWVPRAIGVRAIHDHMKDECLKLRAHFGG